MTSCLLCCANGIEQGSWIRVKYNSARSNEEKEARGKVKRVFSRQRGKVEVTFKRSDGQKMKVESGGKLISFGSHHPITGYAYDYEVKKKVVA